MPGRKVVTGRAVPIPCCGSRGLRGALTAIAIPTVQLEHAITNFDTWKAAFDRDPLDRKGSGVRRHRVLRPVDDPNYAEHFGVVMIDSRDYDDPGWFQDRGETVFAAFSPDPDSFGEPEKTWKINFRVSDLDGIVDELRKAGVTVAPHPEPYPNGRFAELADPEGNQIQLWEPNAASIARDPGSVDRPGRAGPS